MMSFGRDSAIRSRRQSWSVRVGLSAGAAVAALGALMSPTQAAVNTSFASSAMVSLVTTSAVALQVDEREDQRRSRQTLTTSVGQRLQSALEAANLEPPNIPQALQILNDLAARNNLTDYDRATVLEIRGALYAQSDNYPAALRDLTEVLRIDALNNARTVVIRYNVAQMYFAEEDYDNAIRFIRQYLEGSGEVVEDANAWYILSAAYASQGNYQAARQPGEAALRFNERPEKRFYSLLNLIYSELGLNVERARLLEQMIEIWPEEETYWTQLSGAYAQAGREREAFASLEVAYKAGLVTEEDKIVALAQYYSVLDNPYRGGLLIEREMAAGVVQRTLRNYELLAQLWSMARDQDRAIVALREAARLSDRGELYYRIGQSLVASNQFREAIEPLREALRRGGLSQRDRGDIFVLLGTSIYNADDAQDNSAASREARRAAAAEFRRAQSIPSSRSTASDWLQYINGYQETLDIQDDLRRLQEEALRRQEIERCETIIDVAELGGQVDRDRLEECRALVAEAESGDNGDEG